MIALVMLLILEGCFIDCKGFMATYYADSHCLIRDFKHDTTYLEWYLLDTCSHNFDYPEIREPENDIPQSSTFSVEKYKNNSWIFYKNVFREKNCTGIIDKEPFYIFKEFGKCLKLYENIYYKVEYKDEPEKLPFHSVSYTRFESRKNCNSPKIEVDYYRLGGCIWNGEIEQPTHKRYRCDSVKKEYLEEVWSQLISLCLADPGEKVVHKLGVCENGFIYDCKN